MEMCLCVFFMVLLVFYGLHAFCEHEKKERGTSPWLSECGGGCFSCFCLLFFLPSPESFLLQLDHRAIKRII